jgi:hypothetical protein
MEQIRTLTKDEIECRVSLIKDYKKNGKDAAFCQLLLYKDARVDQRLLDEIYGSLNWKREHQLIGDRLYCTVSIWDAEKKEWVSKQDVGTESYTEKEKGQASDSFKRACFNWGIGRELYSAPQITIFLEDNEWKANQKGSLVLNRISFEVSRLEHDEQGNIIYLEIKDDKGRIRFPSKPKEESAPAPAPAPAEDKPAKQKPTFDSSHPKWQEALDKMVAGQGSIKALQSTFIIPANVEEEIKNYLKQHIKN